MLLGLRLHWASASTRSPPPRGGAGRGFGDRPAPAPRLFPLILPPTPQPWSLRRGHAGSPRGETEAGRRVKWATMLVGRGQERPACWAGSCQHRRLEPQERVFLSPTPLSIHVLSHAVPSVQPASCFFPPALLPSLPASSLSIYSFSHLLFHPSLSIHPAFYQFKTVFCHSPTFCLSTQSIQVFIHAVHSVSFFPPFHPSVYPSFLVSSTHLWVIHSPMPSFHI